VNPPPAFLTDFWRDVIAVSGLFGVVLTVFGLGIAYLQLRKKRSEPIRQRSMP